MTLLPGGFVPSYDANGNVLNDSSHQYTWDAEARPVSIDSVGLTYDALGRMVEQNRSSIYTELVYGPNGDKLALMNGQTVQEAFVPLPGNAVAVYNSTGLDHYRHPDWLGSSRFASTSARGMYFDVAYAPFGEPYAQSGTTDLSFTGQNQDTVGGGLTGLYDFPAREYSTQGRWPSPDPGGLGAVVFSDPQTLNRYAYVRNGPLTLTDPSGMYAFGDWPFAFNFGGFPLGGFLWNPNGIGSGICGGPGFCGSIWGEQSPWGLPPWLTSSGIDWTTLVFGPPDPSKLIIQDWHKDAGGNILGDYRGEKICDTDGRCKYWNPTTGRWQDDVPLSDYAQGVFSELNRKGIQSLANPCTPAAFYIGSASGGAIGGSLAGGEAAGVAGTIYQASAPYWLPALNWLYRQASSGFPVSRSVMKYYGKVRDTIQDVCNSMQ